MHAVWRNTGILGKRRLFGARKARLLRLVCARAAEIDCKNSVKG